MDGSFPSLDISSSGWRTGSTGTPPILPGRGTFGTASTEGGKWAHLERLNELPRYSAIVGYLRHLKPNPAILDVGCGEGLLFHRYRPYGYSRYVGLDLSVTVYRHLLETQDENTAFVCADADRYVPEERFDAIVFNETLYYFRSPVDVVDRYMYALNPDGVVIISTYLASHRARAILQALKAKYMLLDETQVTHASNTWTCSVFMPQIAVHPVRSRAWFAGRLFSGHDAAARIETSGATRERDESRPVSPPPRRPRGHRSVIPPV